MSSAVPFPQSKNHLLSVVDKLNYTQRFNYASRIGRDHKNNPHLLTLVNDLLKHPDPPVPEMEAEEGFTEILPAQRTSIAKYYNEDQLALAIAVSAGMFDIIKARLTSPSTFFDHLVFSNYVRMKKETMKVDEGKKGSVEYCASDAEVVKAIIDAVPARRRLLLQESIQSKRLAIIEHVIPQLLALPSYPYHNVAHIIHACSPATVKDFLLKNVCKNVGQVWNKLAKFHVDSILEVFDVTLTAVADPFEKISTWVSLVKWAFSAPKALARLLKNKKAMEKVLDLAEKHPSITFIINDIEKIPVVKPGFYNISLPDIIITHSQIFMKACPDKTMNAFMHTVFKQYNAVLKMDAQVRSAFCTIRAPYHLQNKFIQHVFTVAANDGQPLCRGHGDFEFITKLAEQIPHFNWNTRQLLTVAKMLATYMLKRRPEFTSTSYHVWQQLWSSITTQLISRFSQKLQGIYSKSKKEKAQKSVKLMKKIASYREAIKTVIETFYEVILEDVIAGLNGNGSDFHIRKANVILDSHSNSIKTTDAVITRLVWERVKPSLTLLSNDFRKERPTTLQRAFKYALKLSQNYLSSKQSAFIREEEDYAYNGIKEVFTFLKQRMYGELTEDNIRQLFNVDIDLTFEMFFPKLKEDALACSGFLSEVFTRLSAEQKKTVYSWFSQEDLAHLVKNRTHAFITFVSNLPTALVNEAIVKALSTPNAIDENTRNLLVSYQDITDIKVRNSLQKMSNSNNVSERTGALTSLVTATARSKDLAQINRTLKFIREKIKNESSDNRAEVLRILSNSAESEGVNMLIPTGFGEEQFGFWNDMLADALESPDLDTGVYDKTQFYNHPILSHFQKLGTLALEHCYSELCKNYDEKIFEFGAEVYWKLHVFRHGEKKAAAEFELPFNASKFFKQETNEDGENKVKDTVPALRKALGLYLAAYEKRLTLKNPEWKKSFKYVHHFAQHADWPNVPEIVAVTHAEVERVKAETKKDDDGLHIIPSDDQFCAILTNTSAYSPVKDWHLAPIAEVIDVAIHSRLAPSMVAKWVSWKEHGAKKAREFKARKDHFVPELLKITPSAIHLRFVWRHLVTYMQDKLDDFIGKRKTFRGVFFVGPDQRKFDRSCLKTAATRRPGGRAPVKKARGKKSTKAGVINADVSDPQKKVDEERAKEKEIEEELTFVDESKWDHEDFFYLEACFGLHRLLPRQVNLLAKDWEVQILSADRAIPYKVKATARWTVMPTIAYNDIVTFLNANENKNEVHNGLPVNIIESLLRGVMRNDEPTAPLNFLLSPKFLGSDRSRVSVYAIAQCVPYMPQNGLTSMLKLCLSGKRRQQLKISSYKEIIRLLATTPTDAHLNMIFNEWKRTDLHRDVRIAILTSAMSFLQSNEERFLNIAWKILEHGATLSDQHEILTALLGTVRQGHNRVRFDMDNSAYFKNSRILEHLDDLAKQQIFDEQAARYGTNVIGVIAKTAKNDDIKFLAVSSLFNWPNEQLAIELALAYLNETSDTTMLYSTIPAEQNIFKARWSSLMRNLVDLCVIGATPRPSAIADLSSTLCTRIATMNRQERLQRVTLLGLASEFLNKLPDLCVGEDDILRPFKDTLHNIFAVKLFEKRRARIALLARANKNVLKESLSFLHDITAFCATYPTVSNKDSFYVNQTSYLLKDSNIPLNDILPSLLELKVDASNSAISKTPEYLYLLRQVGMQIQTNIHTFVAASSANAHRVLKFWESVYEFHASLSSLPREHSKASIIFSFAKLIEAIMKILVSKRIFNDVPIYPQHFAELITILANRYADVLEKKKDDPFARDVGHSLMRGNDTHFFAEVAPEPLLFRLVHAVILSNTDESHDIVPKVVKALVAVNLSARANNLITAILDNNLNKEKDWSKDKHYSDLCKSYGLRIIPLSREFAEMHFERVDKFENDIIASLDSFELLGEYDKSVENKIAKLVSIAEAACRYKHVSTGAINRMTKFVEKYVNQTKEGVNGKGTSEQQAVRAIARYYISNHSTWIYHSHKELIPKLADALIRDYANDVILSKSDVMRSVEGLAKTLIGLPANDHVNLSSRYKNFVSSVIHMRLSDQPKNKKYTEISFDLAMALLTLAPSFVVHCSEDTFYFVNWTISYYIQEPDVTSLFTSLTSILTKHDILPALKDAEHHIPTLVKFITSLVDLKHQSFVLPQQKLLPLQAYPQYQHVSLSLALEMVKEFGNYLRITKEREYVWRDEFVALLDRLSDVQDPQIKRQAWDIETVTPKR